MTGRAARAPAAVALAGAGAAAAGSAGPWVEFLGATVGGLEGDGLITLVLALVAVGTTLRGLSRLLPAACGLGIAAVAALDLRDIGDLPIAEPGWGIWLTVAGGVVLLLAGGAGALAARRGTAA